MTAFRLGDVRGLYPDEVDEAFADRFAAAFVRRFGISGTIATGRDARGSSEPLQQALNDGLVNAGVNVANLGLCPTELGYFASTLPAICAAIIVTASHNPEHYNGFKCVLKNGEAVSFDTGLREVMQLMQRPQGLSTGTRGSVCGLDLQAQYLEFFRQRFSFDNGFGGRMALNGLNGTAATLACDLAESLSLDTGWIRRQPGTLPAEGADPNHPVLAAEMKQHMLANDFDLGVAWDGDCDRCVFFDDKGNLVPTYYMVGMFADDFLTRCPGSAVVFDSKLCWNTLNIIRSRGGKAVRSATGHAFMKRSMRDHQAVYGGELSSHHFFRDFFYCDSGMFTWLSLLDVLARREQRLGDLVAAQTENICSTAEINLPLTDCADILDAVRSRYAATALVVDEFDGLSMELPGGWRFSLTRSKTEPLLRLNMESREGRERLQDSGADLLRLLQPYTTSEQSLEDQLVIH